MLKIKKGSNGFTLIELLVVVAIIGILASIVLASLNSARSKGKVANIKSNLKNAIAQAEISYLDNNNYSGACTAIAPMLASITNQGATTSCYSVNNITWGDVYTRWGTTALLSSTGETLEAYSSSNLGVVKWDDKGVTTTGAFVTGDDVTMTWAQANTACSLAGKRLPTPEEIKSLSDTSLSKTGSVTPPGFLSYGYWTGNTVPGNTSNAYFGGLISGVISTDVKSSTTRFVRCVY